LVIEAIGASQAEYGMVHWRNEMTTSHNRLGLAVVIAAALVAPGQALGQTSNTNPTGLFVYPAEGQEPEQQRQDEQECYGWAGEQSQFDPVVGAQQKNAQVAEIEQQAGQEAEQIQQQAEQQAQQIQQQSQADAEAAAAQGESKKKRGIVGGMRRNQKQQAANQQAQQVQQQGQQQAQMTQDQSQQQIQQVWQQAEQQTSKVEQDFLGQMEAWERGYTVCLEGRDYKVN